MKLNMHYVLSRPRGILKILSQSVRSFRRVRKQINRHPIALEANYLRGLCPGLEICFCSLGGTAVAAVGCGCCCGCEPPSTSLALVSSLPANSESSVENILS